MSLTRQVRWHDCYTSCTSINFTGVRLTFFALSGRNEVSQVVLELLGAGTVVGERPKKDLLRGIIRSENQNFHVTFTR